MKARARAVSTVMSSPAPCVVDAGLGWVEAVVLSPACAGASSGTRAAPVAALTTGSIW